MLAHIYALMKEGKFPQRKPIGQSAVGWGGIEIEQWVRTPEQAETRRAGVGGKAMSIRRRFCRLVPHFSLGNIMISAPFD